MSPFLSLLLLSSPASLTCALLYPPLHRHTQRASLSNPKVAADSGYNAAASAAAAAPPRAETPPYPEDSEGLSEGGGGDGAEEASTMLSDEGTTACFCICRSMCLQSLCAVMCCAADGYGQEDQKLMATHANVATSLLEEQDQMVEAQRAHIDSMMKLVKEQMELLKKLDSDVVSVDEYVVSLDQVLNKKQQRLVAFPLDLAFMQQL
jgi:hypothetical protein